MRDNKYNFIYDDTPEKRKFVDNWCKLDLEAGNVVTIGKDNDNAYLIGNVKAFPSSSGMRLAIISV